MNTDVLEATTDNLANADLAAPADATALAPLEATEAELDQIIADLNDADAFLPEQAFWGARKYRQQIIPRLLQSLREAITEFRETGTVVDNAHFFGLYLLSEFQVEEAFPLILEAITLPDEGAFELFGDAVTEALSSILAGFATKYPELIEGLISDPAVDVFVRWAAISANLYLIRDGVLSREECFRKLEAHYHAALARGDDAIIPCVLDGMLNLAMPEMLPLLKDAMARDLHDDSFFDLEYAEEHISKSDESFQDELNRCKPTGVPDAIAELRATFYSECEEQSRLAELGGKIAHVRAKMDRIHENWVDDFGDELVEYIAQAGTIHNTKPHVGRNDPCTCGSGKKFKKCCGG